MARMMKPRPMVSMSTEKCGSPIIGRTARRSVTAPRSAMLAMVAMTAAKKGMPMTLV